MTQQNSDSEMPMSIASIESEMALSPGPTNSSEEPRKKARRGFAAMSPEMQKQLASRGGRASHTKGTGHEWTTESARLAGRKGGLATHNGKS